jgi:hypothetical protein
MTTIPIAHMLNITRSIQAICFTLVNVWIK